MSAPEVTTPGITLRGSYAHGDKVLFKNLELRVEPGCWTCLLGPSGIGKSTLLRLLAGLEAGGDFDGEIVTDDGLPLPGRIAYMAQSDLLPPWLNVRKAVVMGYTLRGETIDWERADALIESVGLGPHKHKRHAELSGGMRQRVALARTLMENRPVALLDEPFSALDARTRAEMQELGHGVLAGKTVLLVTHDPSEAARLGTKIHVITESGMREFEAPRAKPVRSPDDLETLQAQSALLSALRARSSQSLSAPS